MQWDLYCRVIDNWGDIGVCWRLAADLATRGETVRLWTDDRSVLSLMAAGETKQVEVFDWPVGEPLPPPGDVVIEAFGCELPSHVVAAMSDAARRGHACVWLNLEYLSAESYVERSHGLRSPQCSGPGVGLEKWFYYPGYTHRTGGLIREPGLRERLTRLNTAAWFSSMGIEVRPGERVVSLFCYPNAPIPTLLEMQAGVPTLLLLAAGVTLPSALPAGVRAQQLPFLAQTEFDFLLRACDLNFVRGEDSFVRAQWAGRPFVWQIYPQCDGAHERKLEAYLQKFLANATQLVSLEATAIRALWRTWNHLGLMQSSLPHLAAWQAHCEQWRDQLQAQPDLVTGLIEFVGKTR